MKNGDHEPSANGSSGCRDFGDRLKAARERAGMSQERVEEELDFPVRSITRWENEGSDPGFAKVAKMAKLYGVSLDWIASRTPVPDIILPGAILVDEDGLRLLDELVQAKKRIEDIPSTLVRPPGINCATLVPKSFSVFAAAAGAAIEQRIRALVQRLGGK